jgi:outer membrane protein TolC
MLRINNLEEMYKLKASQVNIMTQSIEISSELFATGNANYLEVLITQQNALQSKLDMINARKNQFQASVNIYKALGGGWR